MKNYPKKEHMDRPSSALPHQKYRLKPKQVNARVTTMILTMIGAFTSTCTLIQRCAANHCEGCWFK